MNELFYNLCHHHHYHHSNRIVVVYSTHDRQMTGKNSINNNCDTVENCIQKSIWRAIAIVPIESKSNTERFAHRCNIICYAVNFEKKERHFCRHFTHQFTIRLEWSEVCFQNDPLTATIAAATVFPKAKFSL